VISLRLLSFVGAALVAACGESVDQADVGYDDGYAVGYNTACEIRTTLISGNFENVEYASAYARGQTDGIIACNEDRRAGQRR
jgi:hypothetical protein